MEETVRLPLLEGILPGGLRFGANYLVEFEPQSLWHETSLTLCAQALKLGIKTDYHVFNHTPEDTRSQLRLMGLDIEGLESDETFRIVDSYSVQTGKGPGQKVGKTTTLEWVDLKSVSMDDWNFSTNRILKSEVPEVDRRRLHIDDNTSVLVQFNDEKSVVEHFRTHTVPFVRHLQLAAIHSVAAGIFSDSFYRQFETFCDGIIDFRSQEAEGGMSHSMRLRVARGVRHDSAWRKLELGPNAEVLLVGTDSQPGLLPPSVRSGSTEDRLAVLPFSNISPDPADEYFADGMTEEMISAISKVAGLRVIARTSVMKYKGKDKRASEIARELGVGSLLEGSVRKQGSRARISVKLVDPASEERKWSEEYDRDIQDIFSIQEDISRKVAEALRVHVFQRELRAVGSSGTSNSEAFVQYLRGRQHWNRRTRADLEEAVRRFEEALRIDPAFAKAYTGIADAYAMLASYATEYLPPLVAYPQAQAAVKKALELEPDLVEAHTSLGVVKLHYEWDWGGSEVEFRKSIELGPSYAPAHQFYSDHLKAMGRMDEALREVRKARELDPLSLPINSAVGHVLYLSRQYDAAIEQYRRVVDLDPSFMLTHIWFGRPLLEKGMFDQALVELQTGVRLSGESNVALGMLGHGLAAAGRKDEALEIVRKLVDRSRTQYVSSYWIAAVYNGMKDRENTMEWLRKAFEERSSWLVWCNVEPRFDWLREDPGFSALMKAMKFP